MLYSTISAGVYSILRCSYLKTNFLFLFSKWVDFNKEKDGRVGRRKEPGVLKQEFCPMLQMSRIPDPDFFQSGSASNNLSTFNPKIFF